MHTRSLTSNSSHLKTVGGEMKTSIKEGAIIGTVLGTIIGIGFSLILSIDYSSAKIILFIIALFIAAFGGFAGALVGIGVPKFNPRPEQGRIKKWKAIVFGPAKDSIIYVPEENRKNEEKSDEEVP